MEKEKNREIDTESQLTKYANYYGRNKQIAYYSDPLEEARKPLNEYEDVKNAAQVAKTVYNALANSVEPQYKRKQDWSIAGGIASGLAGPAAGAAIASDIQRKNAEADVYNHKAYESANQQRKALRQKGDDYADSFMEKYNTPYERDKLKQVREQVRQYNKKIDKAKIKLIEERDPVGCWQCFIQQLIQLKPQKPALLNQQ